MVRICLVTEKAEREVERKWKFWNLVNELWFQIFSLCYSDLSISFHKFKKNENLEVLASVHSSMWFPFFSYKN